MNLFTKNLNWFKQSIFKDSIMIQEEIRDKNNPIFKKYDKTDHQCDTYTCVTIRDKERNIFLGFTSPHNPNAINASYSQIRNKIAIDTYKDFDKWSKCPYVVELTKCKSDFDNLIKALILIGNNLDALDGENPFDEPMFEQIESLLNTTED